MNKTNQIPNKQELVDRIKVFFPQVLLEKKIWLAYYYKKNKNGTLDKPPCSQQGHTVSDTEPGCTFDEAIRDGYPGIKMSVADDLIAFDVDDKEAKLGNRRFDISRLSQEFQDFVMEHDSYMELSPSGCGLRIFMTCLDKSQLPGRVNLDPDKCIGGELFMNSGFVTVTGDYLAGTDIKEIKAEALQQWFMPKKTEQAEVIDMPTGYKYPEISVVKEALKCCKLDQSERVKLAYIGIMQQPYNHYDYWLKIMAACHHYAVETNQMSEITSLIVEWSQTDESSYESDEDVIKHWSSFSNQEHGIKYFTLMKFARMLKFQWPEEKLDKGNPTGLPIPTSLVNFEYLMNYYNLKFYSDIFNRNLYVKGDKDILEKFFMSRGNIKNTTFGMVGPMTETLLEALICAMAQKNGYIGINVSTISQLFRNYILGRIEEINLMTLWLNTPADQLPEDMVEKDTDPSKSNLDYLMSCIEFNQNQNIELARMYFNTFFFEMVMPVYNTERKYSQRSFMLILTGPESCRKTTFFSMLFPENMRQHFITTSTETLGGAKSIRDFSTSLVTSALVVIDEFEIFYNKKNDSLFKTMVTSDVVDYVPIYEKTMIKQYKNAVIAGTTNKRSLPFEQDSNRRFALIDVKWINTTAMEEINWHSFYRHYISEGKKAMRNGIHPWKLSKEVIQMQYEENEKYRSQSNKEIILREVFDFDMNIHKECVSYDRPGMQTSKDLYKLRDIEGILKQHYPNVQFPPAEMKHLLKRLCGRYTSTTNLKKPLNNAIGYVEDGIVVQSDKRRYIMPPIITDFD